MALLSCVLTIGCLENNRDASQKNGYFFNCGTDSIDNNECKYDVSADARITTVAQVERLKSDERAMQNKNSAHLMANNVRTVYSWYSNRFNSDDSNGGAKQRTLIVKNALETGDRRLMRWNSVLAGIHENLYENRRCREFTDTAGKDTMAIIRVINGLEEINAALDELNGKLDNELNCE